MNQMNVWGMTDIGLVRKENQDAYVTAQHTASGRTVGVVCDGMGGPAGGRVASPYKPSRRIGAFQKRLESHGITATVRRSLGGDIDASCGQLRRKAMEEAQKGECSQ